MSATRNGSTPDTRAEAKARLEMIRRRNPAEPIGPDVGLLVDRTGAPEKDLDVVLVYLPGFRELARAAGAGEIRGVSRRVSPSVAIESKLELEPWQVLLGYLQLSDARYGDALERRCGDVLIAKFSWAQPDWYQALYDAGISIADDLGLGMVPLREGGLSDRETATWSALSKRREVGSRDVPRGCDVYFNDVLDRIYRPGRGFPKREFSGALRRMDRELKEASRETGISVAELEKFLVDGATMIMFYRPPTPVERRRIANRAKAKRLMRL